MLNKRTIIGLVVGGIIAAVGIAAIVTSIGLQTIEIDETFGIGESTSYKINAPAHTLQFMNITGERFDLKLTSPPGGLQIENIEHKKNTELEWVHLEDGISKIKIQNTGQSELHVGGTVQAITDPILFTYHILVIITGIVIMGFSAGFSARKPKGF